MNPARVVSKGIPKFGSLVITSFRLPFSLHYVLDIQKLPENVFGPLKTYLKDQTSGGMTGCLGINSPPQNLIGFSCYHL